MIALLMKVFLSEEENRTRSEPVKRALRVLLRRDDDDHFELFSGGRDLDVRLGTAPSMLGRMHAIHTRSSKRTPCSRALQRAYDAGRSADSKGKTNLFR